MDKLPYNFKIEGDEKKVSFCFSGQLIINYIEKIVQEVKEKVDFKKDLEVVIDNPEAIDVTFIQLILALKTTYNKLDTNMKLKVNLPDELKTLIVNSGFSNVLN